MSAIGLSGVFCSGEEKRGRESFRIADGLDRRVSKAVSNSGDWDWTYHFYLDGQSVIETRDSADQTISQHLWGMQYIDELIETTLNDDPGDAFRERGVGAEGCAEAGTAVHAESPRTTAEGEDQVRRRKRAMSPFLPRQITQVATAAFISSREAPQATMAAIETHPVRGVKRQDMCIMNISNRSIGLLAAASLPLIIGGWFLNHYWQLRPRLVLTLPIASCPNLRFREDGVAFGPGVDGVCREYRITRGPLFALRGKKAVRFIPDKDMGEYGFGTLETTPGEEGVVYFYRYSSRYWWVIHEP